MSVSRQKQDTEPLFLRIQISLELRTSVCQRKPLGQKARDQVEKGTRNQHNHKGFIFRVHKEFPQTTRKTETMLYKIEQKSSTG